MLPGKMSVAVVAMAVSACALWPVAAEGRGFGGGGYRGGGGGGGGGWNGGGMGSVRYSGGGWNGGGGGWNGGGRNYDNYRPQNNGSLQYGQRDNNNYPAVSRDFGGYGGYGGGWENRPAGGSSDWVKGPAGGAAGVVRGPDGGAAAAYRTPSGGSGAVVQGPGGNTAAVFHGPDGGTVAGARGVYGGAAVAALPPSYAAVNWNGANYYCYGTSFYRPYWYGGAICYWPVSAPTGYFFNTLPSDNMQMDLNGTTYYCSGNTYYTAAQQNGQQGYQVVDNPWNSGAPSVNSAQPDFVANAPDPFKSLQAMSTYIGQLDHFTMTAQDTFDQVAMSGQKTQVSRQGTIMVQRPGQFAATYSDKSDQRSVICDGTQVTVIDVTKNTYGVIPVQGPLDAVLDKLAKDYLMAQPVHNLLYTNLYDRVSKNIQAGQYVGHETLDGVECDHLAFRQAAVDWEVWIQQGQSPLPRKLSVVHTAAPGAPRYQLQITTWSMDPVPASAFTAQIPAGAVKADVLSVTGQAGSNP